MSDYEDEFQEVADDAINSASAIHCPFPDFIAGLELIIENLQDRLQAAKEEQQNRDEDADGDD